MSVGFPQGCGVRGETLKVAIINSRLKSQNQYYYYSYVEGRGGGGDATRTIVPSKRV